MFTSEETIIVTERGGVLQSPDYPNRYPRQTKMSWQLLSPPGTRILLEFNGPFGLEAPEQGRCRWDARTGRGLEVWSRKMNQGTRETVTDWLTDLFRTTSIHAKLKSRDALKQVYFSYFVNKLISNCFYPPDPLDLYNKSTVVCVQKLFFPPPTAQIWIDGYGCSSVHKAPNRRAAAAAAVKCKKRWSRSVE